ncbi:3-keto-5-aminohexanoate cleavage protein [Halomicroarcula sp. GCM10025709]|uniref:3-keto-5-aminohexanoate cleavage protein n=1 Tax=Haloarcula TaxID=2237 RepID=UPI0024C32E39|nr:3-keto-5-aminohexanoate cleavage protein [Halomicroarcula sp. YJ-61-S]
MTYREYMNGAPVSCSVAPTGYQSLDGHGTNVPIEPDAVADDIEECQLLGATIAQLHGRTDDGTPAPSRLPAISTAVTDVTDDILIEYAVSPAAQLGDYLDVIDEGPVPDIAQVFLGPVQHGRREVASISRRDVDRFVEHLVERGIKPNFVVLNGRDINELGRLRQSGLLSTPPMVTVRLGPADGTVATPGQLLALLDAIPADATVFVGATGPNQFPLTTMAVLLGAHVRTGMGDNLYLDIDSPVHRNSQLVGRVSDVVRHSRRTFAAPEDVVEMLSLPEIQSNVEV